MQKYSEDQLIGMIQSGGRALDDAMSYIYRDSRIRLKVLNFMMSKKASREEAEDVFQDSVKILILSIRKGSFRGESTIKNYLFGICKKK